MNKHSRKLIAIIKNNTEYINLSNTRFSLWCEFFMLQGTGEKRKWRKLVRKYKKYNKMIEQHKKLPKNYL